MVYSSEDRQTKLKLLSLQAQFATLLLFEKQVMLSNLRERAVKEMLRQAKNIGSPRFSTLRASWPKARDAQPYSSTLRHVVPKIVLVLGTCPGLGPIRVAELLPIVVTPHRFRTSRQFWG